MIRGRRATLAVALAVPAFFALLWTAEWLHLGVWGPAAVATGLSGGLTACVRRWGDGVPWPRAALHGAVAGAAVGALWTWLWVLPALRIAATG